MGLSIEIYSGIARFSLRQHGSY